MKHQNSHWTTLEHHNLYLADLVILPDDVQKIPNTQADRQEQAELLFSSLPMDVYQLKKFYGSQSSFINQLSFGVFGDSLENNEFQLNPIIDHHAIKSVLEKAIYQCKLAIPTPPSAVIIFPQYCIRNFFHGFCWLNNTMILFVNQNNAEWEKELSLVVAHEYFHGVNYFFEPKHAQRHPSLGGRMIEEGLASTFSSYINRTDSLGGLWKNYPIQEVLHYLKKWKGNFGALSEKEYGEYFLGKGRTPRGMGFAIGYYLAQSYVRHHPYNDWLETARTPLEKLFRQSLHLFLEDVKAFSHLEALD